MRLIDVIDIEVFLSAVDFVMDRVRKAEEEVDAKLFSNVIDPFSAVFDASRQGLSLESWTQQEKGRQVQKTLQNAIGDFHQKILGSLPGWEDLGTGSIVDIVNHERKIIAEIKNKYNTTKGNHKTQIYKDLKECISTDFKNYTGYYVEIIPKHKKTYTKPFTPSDNKLHKQLAKNNRILVTDGWSFYALASGIPDALKQLYTILPSYIQQHGCTQGNIEEEKLFWELFNRVY